MYNFYGFGLDAFYDPFQYSCSFYSPVIDTEYPAAAKVLQL